MAETAPHPRQTLALLLGASEFPYASKLAQGRAFANSAEDFRKYLMEGLRLPPQNVGWFFDDRRSPNDQLFEIESFLKRTRNDLTNQGIPPHDLIIYYVGHGHLAPDRTYSLAIRGTREGIEGVSSIRVSDLSVVIKKNARYIRKLLILDCCFSAVAYKEFQSGPQREANDKLLTGFPEWGTTLLCSSSSEKASLAPQGLAHTMFSDALLVALRKGDRRYSARLSVNELCELVKRNMREKAFPHETVRPEVHSPEQSQGDIARIPMFPNPAYGTRNTSGEPAKPRPSPPISNPIKISKPTTLPEPRKAKIQEVDNVRRRFLWYFPTSATGWILRLVLYFFTFLTIKGFVTADGFWGGFGVFILFMITCSLWAVAVWHGNKHLEAERLRRRLSEVEWQLQKIKS